MQGLAYQSTPKKNTTTLRYMLGLLEKHLTKREKQKVQIHIQDYRNELVPLITPITLILNYVKKYNITDLLDQAYLNPHPQELMLRNHA